MKKFFTLFILSVLAYATASAVDVRLDIDDPQRVIVMVNDDTQSGLTSGLNTLDVESGSYVQVEAASGCTLVSVTEVNGSYSYDMPIYAEDGRQFSIINVYSDYGDTYVVRTASSGDIRTATCTIDVDDASKVKVIRVSDEAVIDLTDGANTYSFDPASETGLRIQPVDKALYAVTLDGTPVESNGYSYSVTLVPDCTLKIEANYPDKDYAVHLLYTGDDAEDFISGVDVDGRPVFNYNDPSFTVKAGSEVKLYGRTNEYEVDEFTINGTSQSFFNPFTFIVTEETTVSITVHKYASFKMTVNVDDPARVHAYRGYSYNGDEYTLTAGANTVEVIRNTPIISLVPAEGCYLKSVTVDGYSYSADELHTSPLMIGSLTATSVLDITTGIIVRDLTATVTVDYDGEFRLLRSDRSEVEGLAQGINTISFYEGDNPFELQTNSISGIKVELNGVAVSPKYPESPDYQIVLTPGANLKISRVQTGIGSVGTADTEDAPVYNLSGVKVSDSGSAEALRALPAGFYISNGKKIVITK